MSIGIEIVMKDGSKDWVDPVDESEFDNMFNQATDTYAITNTHGTYNFPVDMVNKLVKYELHLCCGYDARYHHSFNCDNRLSDD